MIRRSLTLAGAVLTAFHVWLFAGQVWSGAIADPGLVFRWLVAAGLIGGLVLLRRQGESLLFSRKAIALWVLAALLHGPALANRLESPSTPAVPEVIVTLTQTLTLVGLTGLGFLLAARLRRRPTFSRVAVVTATVLPVVVPDTGVRFLPRPPPIA